MREVREDTEQRESNLIVKDKIILVLFCFHLKHFVI